MTEAQYLIVSPISQNLILPTFAVSNEHINYSNIFTLISVSHNHLRGLITGVAFITDSRADQTNLFCRENCCLYSSLSLFWNWKPIWSWKRICPLKIYKYRFSKFPPRNFWIEWLTVWNFMMEKDWNGTAQVSLHLILYWNILF